MRKLITQNDYEGLDALDSGLLTVIDSEKHLKSAATNKDVREMLQGVSPSPNQFLLHVVALGDEEHYSFNRNGDSFPKEACLKHHDTFVKKGHFFREHKNRDPKYKIGDVVASCYNADMGRIELAVLGDRDLAGPEYELVKKGSHPGVSMSCTVPYDVSSITGKKAKHPGEYDDYCKYQMTKWIPSHQKFAFVRNTEPCWFDISAVAKPADRIAYTVGAALEGTLEKAASNHSFKFSCDLAKEAGVSVPDYAELLNNTPAFENNYSARQLLTKLAAIEERIANTINTDTEAGERLRTLVKYADRTPDLIKEEHIETLKEKGIKNFMRKSAFFGAMLPLDAFAAITSGRPQRVIKKITVIVPDVESEMPSIFRNLLSNGVADSTIEDLTPVVSGACSGKDPIDSLMDRMEDGKLLKSSSLNLFSKVANCTEPNKINTNSGTTTNSAITDLYALYKVATLRSMANYHGSQILEDDEILEKVVLQNFISFA